LKIGFLIGNLKSGNLKIGVSKLNLKCRNLKSKLEFQTLQTESEKQNLKIGVLNWIAKIETQILKFY
jgi:hypothetical protein